MTKFFEVSVQSSYAREVLKDLVTTVLKVDHGIQVKLAGEIIHRMRVIAKTDNNSHKFIEFIEVTL